MTTASGPGKSPAQPCRARNASAQWPCLRATRAAGTSREIPAGVLGKALGWPTSQACLAGEDRILVFTPRIEQQKGRLHAHVGWVRWHLRSLELWV